jgi:hypothetical protein
MQLLRNWRPEKDTPPPKQEDSGNGDTKEDTKGDRTEQKSPPTPKLSNNNHQFIEDFNEAEVSPVSVMGNGKASHKDYLQTPKAKELYEKQSAATRKNLDDYLKRLENYNSLYNVKHEDVEAKGEAAEVVGNEVKIYSSDDPDEYYYAQLTDLKIDPDKYKVNPSSAQSVVSLEKIASARKLQNDFSLIISKVAEDHSYIETVGDDEWDINELMKRSITHRSLGDCRLGFDRERIAILLDTSPSCLPAAKFYAEIASAAIVRGDCDIYDAPNGEIWAKYSHKLKRFIPYDVSSNWGLDGRIGIYFTDWDGYGSIIRNSRVMKQLYWLEREKAYFDTTAELVALEAFEGKIFPCRTGDDLINIGKKLR